MKPRIKELVVISGKGGTGKTSIVASFAALAGGSAVCADCDVDAADLHLILDPQTIQSRPFVGRQIATIAADKCAACGICAQNCRFDAITPAGPDGTGYRVDPVECEGCGVCQYLCPEGAIAMEDAVDGHWFIGDTRFGPLVHARLEPGGENSGKLVTTVRRAAREIAGERGYELIIVDGSPGIGCPVIASVTNADLALIITEPTLSGEHDLRRIAQLTARFGVETVLCINKRDINPEIAERITNLSQQLGIETLAGIGFDDCFTAAQIEGVSIVEHGDCPAAQQVISLWRRIASRLGLRQSGPRAAAADSRKEQHL